MLSGLPDILDIPRKLNYEFYGAIYNIAEICNLRQFSLPLVNKIIWQHGWHGSDRNVDPRLVIGYNDYDKDKIHLVARKDQSDYLRSEGYKHVFSIGLPICYVPSSIPDRIPGSLLVMPAHSLAYTRHSWKCGEYVAYINSFRKSFSEIAVCVHPSCVHNNYWIKEFEEAGYQVVIGANSNDRNALKRMKYLLKRYEYMTTNQIGSHVVYGSYFGSKVSIAGPYAYFKQEDFTDSQYYKSNPDLLKYIKSKDEHVSYVKNRYKFLFTDPHKASCHLDWGARQVGHENVLHPSELRSMFRLDLYSQFKNRMEITGKKIKDRMKATFNLVS